MKNFLLATLLLSLFSCSTDDMTNEITPDPVTVVTPPVVDKSNISKYLITESEKKDIPDVSFILGGIKMSLYRKTETYYYASGDHFNSIVVTHFYLTNAYRTGSGNDYRYDNVYLEVINNVRIYTFNPGYIDGGSVFILKIDGNKIYFNGSLIKS
jgi:hypothetical protein